MPVGRAMLEVLWLVQHDYLTDLLLNMKSYVFWPTVNRSFFFFSNPVNGAPPTLCLD